MERGLEQHHPPKKQQGVCIDYGFNYNLPAHHLEQPEGEVVMIIIIIVITHSQELSDLLASNQSNSWR